MRRHISPADWGLESSLPKRGTAQLRQMGLSKRDIEDRCRRNTYEWLLRQYNQELGAFHGFYDPRSGEFADAQTVNLIAPWQLLAAYDRYDDENLLQMATRCADWLHSNMMESHPMSLVLGGVRDNLKPAQIWTKYTADYVVLNLGIHQRTGNDEYLQRAIQSGRFLLQAQNHDFAPKYDTVREIWMGQGWQSFGRVVCAMLALHDVTNSGRWLKWATEWGDLGLDLQAGDGAFYVVHGNYYSSDVSADEIRALLALGEDTGRPEFRDAAIRFANWHLEHQREDGSWWLAIDRWGTRVSDYVGPGDAPNIAIALIAAHQATGNTALLAAAIRAFRFSLALQATPDCGDPYLEDDNIRWGFWSWAPYYDYTMSSDQSTHHVRGLWFFLDYFYSLPNGARQELAQAAAAPA